MGKKSKVGGKVEKGKKSFKSALMAFHQEQAISQKKQQLKQQRLQQENNQLDKKKGNKSNKRPNKVEQHVNSLKKTSTESSPSSSSTSNGKLSSLQQQYMKKLEGARFRSINEELYTSRGDVAFQDFQRDPSKFDTYHKGYREQAAQWPSNPLDAIIAWIASEHKRAVVADMGCGEARLGASLSGTNKIHSFDLVAANSTVTACDIAHVPLEDASVDIVVFCLSLMGVNMVDFIREAHRILKIGGILKIAEVRSRFGDNKGILAFNKFLLRAGFEVKPYDKMSQNKMFFEVECTKVTDEGVFDSLELKPCQYKKR